MGHTISDGNSFVGATRPNIWTNSPRRSPHGGKSQAANMMCHAATQTTNTPLLSSAKVLARNAPPRQKSLDRIIADNLIAAQFIRVNSQLPGAPAMK
jgi:hypothetical protein